MPFFITNNRKDDLLMPNKYLVENKNCACTKKRGRFFVPFFFVPTVVNDELNFPYRSNTARGE